MTFQIEASTPQEMCNKIVAWLREQATNAGVDARLAVRHKVSVDYSNKRDALMAAAAFIDQMKIISLPKQSKCPNCGEELI